uniref:Uncharacterized protein n=1 Tax=Anguilla anguilla TaxID=7936 RepID=A0A0E9TLW3_ANGAN
MYSVIHLMPLWHHINSILHLLQGSRLMKPITET